MKKYHLDLDYGFRKDVDFLFVFMKISINRVDVPLDGYSIFCEGVGVLKNIDFGAMPDQDKADLKFLILSYCLSQLRSYIAVLTASSSFGKYLLPLINLDGIVKEKIKQKENRASVPIAPKKKIRVRKKV
jgi:hypothetical protein